MKHILPTFKKPNSSRSANMQAIRSKGNRSTEWRLRSLLIRNRCRGWTIQSKDILGVPDFTFPDSRVAVFIDGCFWHGCPKCGHIPKTNVSYWAAKIARNQNRDKKYSKELRSQGFTVIRIWECALKTDSRKIIERILRAVNRVP